MKADLTHGRMRDLLKKTYWQKLGVKGSIIVTRTE
jgi:hypothetical protein